MCAPPSLDQWTQNLGGFPLALGTTTPAFDVFGRGVPSEREHAEDEARHENRRRLRRASRHNRIDGDYRSEHDARSDQVALPPSPAPCGEARLEMLVCRASGRLWLREK